MIGLPEHPATIEFWPVQGRPPSPRAAGRRPVGRARRASVRYTRGPHRRARHGPHQGRAHEPRVARPGRRGEQRAGPNLKPPKGVWSRSRSHPNGGRAGLPVHGRDPRGGGHGRRGDALAGDEPFGTRF